MLVTEGNAGTVSDTLRPEAGEIARRALDSSPIRALRALRVEDCSNGLVISGTVTTYYHKQMAQEVIRAVVRDVDVINSITVQ